MRIVKVTLILQQHLTKLDEEGALVEKCTIPNPLDKSDSSKEVIHKWRYPNFLIFGRPFVTAIMHWKSTKLPRFGNPQPSPFLCNLWLTQKTRTDIHIVNRVCLLMLVRHAQCGENYSYFSTFICSFTWTILQYQTTQLKYGRKMQKKTQQVHLAMMLYYFEFLLFAAKLAIFDRE